VDQREIVVSNSELELAHGFDERRGLDITNSPTKLPFRIESALICELNHKEYFDDAHVWRFPCIINWYSRDAFDPILYRVCYVRDDLNGILFI
jgi:hypothetical protein